MRSIFFLIIAAVASFFLTGCANQPALKLEQRAAQINSPFELLGRVAIRQ